MNTTQNNDHLIINCRHCGYPNRRLFGVTCYACGREYEERG